MSESKLYPILGVFKVKVELMPYYRWDCFLYLKRPVARVKEFATVIVIVRIELIPDILGFPMLESKLNCTFPCSESIIHFISLN